MIKNADGWKGRLPMPSVLVVGGKVISKKPSPRAVGDKLRPERACVNYKVMPA